LEEVGDVPDSVQPKLLRLLQDRRYERVGEFAPRDADVRVVATTSVDLADKVAAGAMRADLRDALGVVVLDLPPLRRRGQDVVRLAETYAAFFSRQLRRPRVRLSEALVEAMARHSWPGNVRELRNFVERAVIVARSDVLDVADCPPGLLNEYNSVAVGDAVSVDRIEEMHIRAVIASSPSIDSAAKVLGMDTVTLWRRRKSYGI
jgi:NtrC-family two-component system response regulator AlgB